MFKKSIIFVFAVLIFVCQIFGNDPVQAAVRGRYEADAVTYMKFSDMDQALPVSFVQKGQQLLTGDGEKNVDSILRETVLKDALPAEQLPGMEAGAVYGKGRQPDDPGMVITNGSWELFPDQAEYQAYSIWKQPAKYRWKKYFKRFLKNSLLTAR